MQLNEELLKTAAHAAFVAACRHSGIPVPDVKGPNLSAYWDAVVKAVARTLHFEYPSPDLKYPDVPTTEVQTELLIELARRSPDAAHASQYTRIPLVLPDDDGIRPAGNFDECFYCKQKIGTPHKFTCGMITHKVEMAFTVKVELDVPIANTIEDTEFRYNESSWCANNLITFLDDMIEKGQCLCSLTSAKFVRVTDPTPRGRRNVRT